MKKSELKNIISEVIKEEAEFPDLKKWWKEEPEKVMSYVYWQKRQLPPSDRKKWEKSWNDVQLQLNKKYPAPSSYKLPASLPDEEGYFWLSSVTDTGRKYWLKNKTIKVDNRGKSKKGFPLMKLNKEGKFEKYNDYFFVFLDKLKPIGVKNRNDFWTVNTLKKVIDGKYNLKFRAYDRSGRMIYYVED